MLNKIELALVCAFSVVTVSEFLLGVLEIYHIVGSYDKYQSPCKDIREWIIIDSVIDLSVSICTFIGILIFLSKYKNKSLSGSSIYRNKQINKIFAVLALLQLLQAITGSWSIVQYVGTDTVCRDYWESLDLWVFVFAHSLIMWIYLSAIALFLITYSLMYVCALLCLISESFRALYWSESPAPKSRT